MTYLWVRKNKIDFLENEILFENEQDYLNLFYLEKVVFDFIKNLLYNKDLDKELRIYFRLTLINNYLKSLPNYTEIKIFYDVRYENPFKVKFPFICCFEDLDKRGEYLKEIEFLGRENVERYCGCDICDCDRVGDCDCDCDDCLKCVCDDCDFCVCDCACDVSEYGKLYYEGEPLIFRYHKLIKL